MLLNFWEGDYIKVCEIGFEEFVPEGILAGLDVNYKIAGVFVNWNEFFLEFMGKL